MTKGQMLYSWIMIDFTGIRTHPPFMYAMRQRGHIGSHVAVDIIMISDDWLSVYGTGDRPQGAAHTCVNLGDVDEGVDVGLVPLHVLVLDQPLDLLLDEFFTWQEHILQDIHQFSL